MKTLALSLAIAAGPLWAESPTLPEQTSSKTYQSAFADYRPFQDETVQDWRKATMRWVACAVIWGIWTCHQLGRQSNMLIMVPRHLRKDR